MEIVRLGPLPVASVTWQPAPHACAITLVCKATFPLAPGEASLAQTQEQPCQNDVYWNNEAHRSLFSPGDLAPIKLRADVLLVGSAYAPHGEQVRSLITRLKIAGIDKSLDVLADRAIAQDGAVVEGPRFTRMPLVWERAAGGPGTSNPVGMRGDQHDNHGWTPLPNLAPLGHGNNRPPPVGFGPVAASWPPRRELLGHRASTWPTSRWAEEPMPADIDLGYFNAAPRDQQVDKLLDNEGITLENLHPHHPSLTMTLPGLRPRARVERPSGAEDEVLLRADTLWIDTDRCLVTLVWRGRVRLDHPAEPGRIVVDVAPPPRRAMKPSDVLKTLAPSLVSSPAPLPFMPAPPPSQPRPPDSAPLREPSPWAPSAYGNTEGSFPSTPVAASFLGAARATIALPEPVPPPNIDTGGVLAASDHAAAITARPSPEPAPEEPPAPAPEPVAKPPRTDGIKLIWFDPAVVPRIRRQREWRLILTDLELRLIDEAAADLAAGPLPPEDKDKRTVREVLLRAQALSPDGVPKAVDGAIGDDGGFEPPLVVVSAELEMPFDEIETLKALATAARPLGSTDKRMKEVLDSVDELITSPWLAGSFGTAESLTTKVRETFAQVRRTLAPDYLDAQAERRLLEQRAYQARPIFGKKHLRGVITGASGPIPVYLPEATRDDLPMFRRFRATLMAELHHREDQGEQSPFAIKVLALSRAIGAAPRHAPNA